MTTSTSGRSSRISSPAVPLPAMNWSSSNGCTNRPRIRFEPCCSTVRQHSSYVHRTIVAPSCSIARSLIAGAVSTTITEHGTPATRAASATPCAALPALTVQTPSCSVARGAWRITFQAPRILNEPTGCSVSSFRKISPLRGPWVSRQVETDQRRAHNGVCKWPARRPRWRRAECHACDHGRGGIVARALRSSIDAAFGFNEKVVRVSIVAAAARARRKIHPLRGMHTRTRWVSEIHGSSRVGDMLSELSCPRREAHVIGVEKWHAMHDLRRQSANAKRP